MGLNCFRVSLIGTGGGYGESIVAQLGENNWIVVDSCIDPITKKSLPLLYLKSLGVDIKKNVKLIVCSHWHDDHILGMQNLLKECESAVFSIAITTDQDKFVKFIGLDSRKDKVQANTSSTDIMAECLEIMKKRKMPIRVITQDRILLSIREDNLNVQVCALSPSDTVIAEFGSEISKLIKDYCPLSDKKIIVNSPNKKCVVLLICVNGNSVILGGDLEKSADKKHGWLCILDNCSCIPDDKVSLFKIPHHGSENAYEERVWDQLLDNDVVGQLSPFIKGNVCLPTKEMLKKFLMRTKHLYITSYANSAKPKQRDSSIEKMINRFNPTLKEIRYKEGIIDSCLDLNSGAHEWVTTLHEGAFEIDSKFVRSL